jgi:rSAM/selenodomain-associated transferase 1
MLARILVIAKSPIPGEVKTRLELPPRLATDLQCAFIEDVVRKALCVAPVTVAGAGDLSLVRPLLPEGVPLIPQIEGERMLGGAKALFDRGEGQVVIVGTDAPTLPVEHIREAAEVLGDYDASIVRADDGGYVLIGIKEPHETLFRGIEWSTERVYRQTVDAAQGAGISLYELPGWYDVDIAGDLERLGEDHLLDELAPRTAEILKGRGESAPL